MQTLLDKHYTKETKVASACLSRAPNATLVPGKDKLSVVYDVFTNISAPATGDYKNINLMFLHGSGMNRAIWEYHIANFTKFLDALPFRFHKIVTLDQVNHGDSLVLNKNKLGVNFDWVDGARDACKVAELEFLQETTTTKAINVVVGHSMGGFQALSCGILFPYLFEVIIPIEPVVLTPVIPNEDKRTIIPENFYRALKGKMKDRFSLVECYDRYMEKETFYNRVHPEILARIKNFEKVEQNGQIITKMTNEQNMICYATLYPGGLWLIQSLESIVVPVYGIVGGVSNWCPPENQELLIKKIPNYEKVVIQEGDHLLNIELPDICIEHILRAIANYCRIHASENPGIITDLSDDKRESKFHGDFEKFINDRVDRKGSKRVLAKF
ncbi:hypothetical protein KAFR_0D02300 [Kazachstania africana CBS 2517]|uniref:AB hydrolase-1 domain-containing protein n=1 Tax=Kazachstania africana (strain ATCC 22294 / BCRC 22015 / CBS 2517 / CECT 1963 / NBRC 1671 / NRRL Y-8276) TaxID=1071382 RepID=H2AU27_KAZAF|nr:hypothetical protein KAFR_0D02300 [Kazachstania africana CBS 2517]CCF57877.1 hypothetical protein KAFR_0D02300 [Kazachstania africana CBS 2517]